MKIIRDGKVIELTQQELYVAYYEQQRNFDLEDLIDRIDEMQMDGDIEPVDSKALAEKLVDKYREALDEDDVRSEAEWMLRNELIEEEMEKC